MMLHCFYDDDRIIDNQADRQNHGKQGQRINGKPKEDKSGKSTDQRYRHGQHGDQGGPPVLQEQIDDDHNQNQSLNKGLKHLGQ